MSHRLKKNQTIIPVVFNPWYLATEAALIQSFYASIERELQSRYIIVGLRRTLSRYRDLLSSGLRSLGLGLELPIRDDPGRLRLEIESWVARTGCRLVILIDDIDRLLATEVLSVFKLAALSARLQNTVFILCFDQVMISKMLKDTAATDPAFLEKVIQKPLQLPPAEQGDIDRFLLFYDPGDSEGHKSAIDRLLDAIGVDAEKQKEFRQHIDSFYRIRLRGLFRTVRQAKRYLNSLRATLPAIVNEIDLYDFALLEIMQVFFPKVYQDIWRSPWFYVPPWTPTAMFTFPVSLAHNEEEKYRCIQEHIEELLRDEPQRDLIKCILEELFCAEVPRAFGHPGMTICPQGTRTYREAKRLTHPDCFPKYFLYRIPKEEKLSDQSVEDLIRQWNKASESPVEGLVEESLRQHQAVGQLPELLSKLRTFIALIAPARVAAIVRGLSQSVSFLSRDFIFPGRSEYHLTEESILRLIDERADSAAIQSLLEAVVKEVPNLHFAVQIVASYHGQPRRDLQQIFRYRELHGLRMIATQRLNTYYVQQEHDIFAELPEDDWDFVLYQWGTDWMTYRGENRSVVRYYVIRLIEGKPEYLGPLLRQFIDRDFGQQNGGFRYNEFCQLYDPTAMLERLDRHGERALRGSEERRAADLFRQQYTAYGQPTLPAQYRRIKTRE